MAYTKIIAIRSRLDVAINYVLNDSKTHENNLCFQGAANCSINSAHSQMKETKELFSSNGIIQGYHIIQSFAPNETDPQTAFEIANKFVGKYLSVYESVYSTHVDKDHVHNHIVFSSVSFKDGRKYRSNISTYYKGIRKTSDDICKEYGLSIIEPVEHSASKHYAEWMADKKGFPTWRNMIKHDIEEFIVCSRNFDSLMWHLESFLKYEVNQKGKYITVKPLGAERSFRLKSLGAEYTKSALIERIDFEMYGLHFRKYEPTFIPKPPKGSSWLSWMIWYDKYKFELQKRNAIPTIAMRQSIVKANKMLKRSEIIQKYGISNESDLTRVQSEIESRIESMVKERDERNLPRNHIFNIGIQNLRRELFISKDIPIVAENLGNKIDEIYRRSKSKNRNIKLER
jgi:hypothetical protein